MCRKRTLKRRASWPASVWTPQPSVKGTVQKNTLLKGEFLISNAHGNSTKRFFLLSPSNGDPIHVSNSAGINIVSFFKFTMIVVVVAFLKLWKTRFLIQNCRGKISLNLIELFIALVDIVSCVSHVKSCKDSLFSVSIVLGKLTSDHNTTKTKYAFKNK